MRAVRLLIAGALAVVLTLVVRTALVREPGGEWPAEVAISDSDGQRSARRLAAVLRLQTAADPATGRLAAGTLAAVVAFLSRTYPRALALRTPAEGDGLVLCWPGHDATGPPIVLLAHVDVVPSRAAGAWRHAPFAGATADGAVWGRGALDDKGGLIALLDAIESLLGRDVAPARTVYVVIAADEERDGAFAAAVAARLRQDHPGGLGLVLDEGSFVTRGMFPGVDRPVALLGIAEKGYLTLRLTVTGPEGHSSVPAYPTTLGRLAAAMIRLEHALPPARLGSTTAMMFDRVAPAMSFGPRLIFANRWLFRPLVRRMAASDRRFSALVRSTAAPIDVAGGVAENVLPRDATATYNLRLMPGDSRDGMMAWVRAVVARDGARVEPVGEGFEASPIGSPTGPGFRLVAATLRRLAPLRAARVVVAPALVPTATASRFFQGQGAEIVRLRPFVVTPADAAGVHGIDERVTIDNLSLGVAFYRTLLERLDRLE